MKAGKITVITGPMFASKTTTLVGYLNKEKYRHRHVVCYKPAKDNRYSTDEVVSHDGTGFPCVPLKNSTELKLAIHCLKSEETPVSFGIDEIQFFDAGITHLLWDLSLKGYRIFAAGLDLDSFGKPFGPMAELLAYADKIVKLNAQCKVCGENARMTYRNENKSTETVLVGGAEFYEPRCKFHWNS